MKPETATMILDLILMLAVSFLVIGVPLIEKVIKPYLNSLP